MNDFRPTLYSDITDAVRAHQRQQRARVVYARACDFIGREGDAWFASLEVEMGVE